MAQRARRPGKGGRQPREHVHTPTTATQRLFDDLGPPLDVIPSSRGAITRIWRTPAADRTDKKKGAIVGRLSSRELQNGETMGGQLQDGFRLERENEELAAAYVIASTDFYSELPYEERTDFQLLEELFSSGQCDWVAFREPDRVGREIITCELFYEMVKRHGAQLWLADLGREVDWANDADVFAIGAKNLLGQMERNKIKQRTQGALRRRWLEEGRGWPGAIRFGFRRNEHTRFPEIDPEQWPAVVFLHENYARATTRGNGRHVGVAALGRMLYDTFGFELSDDRIRTILKDPIYSEGTYTVNCHGHPIACEPIPLGDQAIPLQTFQANQELMAVRRGANNVTPIGTFPLNGLKIIHHRCRDERHPKTGRATTMKVRVHNGCAPRLYHDHFSPKTCRGYSLDPDLILDTVCQQLLRLADDPDLQKAWARAARPETTDKATAYTAAQLTELRGRLANVENERDRLATEWAKDIGAGSRTADLNAYAEIQGALENEAARLRNELEVAEAKEASSPREPRKPLFGASNEDLQRALREILTIDNTADQPALVRRMAVIEACLSAIEIHDVELDPADPDTDEDDEHAIELILIGHLLPPGDVRAGKLRNGSPLPVSPLDSARPLLEAHIAGQAEGEAGGGEVPDDSRTSVQGGPYTEVRDRLIRGDLTPKPRRKSKRGHIPCWYSDRVRVPPARREYAVPRRWDRLRWTDKSCRSALLRAGRELEPGEVLTFGRLQELRAAHPHSFPAMERFEKAARREGLSFPKWRDLHLSGLAADAPRDSVHGGRRFSDAECEAAMREVAAELGPGRAVTLTAYDDWSRGHPERPPRTRVEAAAAARGLTFPQLRAVLVGDPWDLERVEAALAVADANVDRWAEEDGPNREWALARRARRHMRRSTGFRREYGDWERALGEAAHRHPSARDVRRCARDRGVSPAQLFTGLRTARESGGSPFADGASEGS